MSISAVAAVVEEVELSLVVIGLAVVVVLWVTVVVLVLCCAVTVVWWCGVGLVLCGVEYSPRSKQQALAKTQPCKTQVTRILWKPQRVPRCRRPCMGPK